jgi:hypothetical protein
MNSFTMSVGALCLLPVRRSWAAPAEGPGAPKPEGLPDRFTYVGEVVKERGEPVAGAKVTAVYLMTRGYGYIAVATTDAAGRFDIDRDRALSGIDRKALGDQMIRITATHDDYHFGRVENVQRFAAAQCTNLRIEMTDSRKLVGHVTDPAGKGVAGAMVTADFKDEPDERKAVYTAADGAFELRGLPRRETALEVLANDPSSTAQSGRATIAADHDDAQPLTVKVEPIKLPEGDAVREVLGMKVCDATPELAAAFHQPADGGGVIVLDPGKDPERLHIGELRRGDQFWLVGNNHRVKSAADFAAALAEESKPAKGLDGIYLCRVVYNFHRRNFAGSNTQHLRMTEQELKALQGAGGNRR